MPNAKSPEGRSQARKPGGWARAFGLGIVTGAADDDCSAIGTYASAGAQFGTSLLWTAPASFPMMFAVVYLSAKLGQVTGKGLFQVIREYFPKWILWPTLVGCLIGNIIEAGADLGGMAAAIGIFLSVPAPITVIVVAAIILGLQFLGSYEFIRNVFRWLALALLAYVGSAVLAKPDPGQVLRDSLIPHIELSREYLSMLVAIIGTTLSAYLYSWQSNVEVEEKIAHGKTSLRDRQRASEVDLRRSGMDTALGMFFSNLIMYFIILCTGATLHKAGVTNIETAAQAAEALRPLAGNAAGVLFAIGVIAVGFLAVPVMTTGAAYDLCQVLGWKGSLNARPVEAPKFYALIAGFTAIGVLLNFFGFNPMKALVYSGIVQGFSTPPLLLLIMLITNNRAIMGDKVNGRPLNVLGWITLTAISAASIGLIVTTLV